MIPPGWRTVTDAFGNRWHLPPVSATDHCEGCGGQVEPRVRFCLACYRKRLGK